MTPDPRFTDLSRSFWACVRKISERVGYTVRGQHTVRVPQCCQMRDALDAMGMNGALVADAEGSPTQLGSQLQAYYAHRADVLNNFVEPRLMHAEEAGAVFATLHDELSPGCPIPMNKQKGEKRKSAFLTGIVNMLVEANAAGIPCDYDPRQLTTITRGGAPLRTLSRRVDGAFPSATDPIAVWEVKEYYYTTSFGSRVADGVYETLLDGMELAELSASEGIHVLHYLMVDAYYTWWDCGRSYLCRILDALHMGYLDEVLFGREVVERLPAIVREWARLYAERQARPGAR